MAVEPPVFAELAVGAKTFTARQAYPSTCCQVVISLPGASFPRYYLHKKETVVAKGTEMGKRKREREKRKEREKGDRRRERGEWLRGEGEREILVTVPRCFMILCALLQDLSLDVAYVKGGGKKKKKKRELCL